jgi:hypothetical protein
MPNKNVIYGAAALAVAFASSAIAAQPGPPPSQASPPQPICGNLNSGDVSPNPPTVLAVQCQLTGPATVALIQTYHWNNAKGAAPGFIVLVNWTTQTAYGPFAAKGSSGNGVANVLWTATVNLTLPAGSYSVFDSDLTTWSTNGASGGAGFAQLLGSCSGAARCATILPSTPPARPPTPQPSSAPTSSAASVTVCSNFDASLVDNAPTTWRGNCTLSSPANITQIQTYHWNRGQGATPGYVLLVSAGNDTVYGPFPTLGSPANGVSNALWTATVNLTLPAGSYVVVDSDLSSWSWDTASAGAGFARLLAPPPPPPPPNPCPPGFTYEQGFGDWCDNGFLRIPVSGGGMQAPPTPAPVSPPPPPPPPPQTIPSALGQCPSLYQLGSDKQCHLLGGL